MTAQWRRSSIHTPQSRARTAQRLDRRIRSVDRVVAHLRAGGTLHLAYGRRPIWTLSPGDQEIDAKIARLLIQRPDVIAVGDTLFDGVPSQTYRIATD